ncbi:MAG: DUF2207 domain-containing protein, partial [Ruminococcus sp.]
MKRFKNVLIIAVWLVVVCLISNTGFLISVFSPEAEEDQRVEEDPYMTTRSYRVELNVGEDNSYRARESITVSFQNARHGIYRYIPDRGRIALAGENNEVRYIPYYAQVRLTDSGESVESDQENGNQVFRFGDEDRTVREGNYVFSYTYRPVTQDGYTDFYYNIFPDGWQNEIPAGSSFSIHFPKTFSHDLLQFYYGSYGEQNQAGEILELSWNGSTVTGVLTQSLPVGSGLTCYADMEEGYFTNVADAGNLSVILTAAACIVLVILTVLFLLFGRDEPVYPSIQYMPPDDLDSAAVGY